MSPERFQKIKIVLNQRQPDLTVITDEVHKGRNLSAIMRVCDAVGIEAFHCVQPKLGFRSFRGTALGTQKWIDCTLHDSIEDGISLLKSQGFRIVAANLSDRAKDYTEVDYTQPTALLLGTEKQGVSDVALASADEEVIVPMMGMVESYNVSAACAVILQEARKQRQRCGMYDRSRIPAERYRQKLFRWCQPEMAEYCDRRGIDYPELDDEGDLLNPSEWFSSLKSE